MRGPVIAAPARFRGRRASSSGAGLIEILVAIVILAFGMLGIAAMQATALRNSQSALERSQAIVQTYSMLEAMRANRDAAMIGVYDLGAFVAATPGDPPTGVVAANGWTCNLPDPGSLVANDWVDWLTSVKENLGDSACGAIDCTTEWCVVAIRWNDARGSDGDEHQSVVTRTRL